MKLKDYKVGNILKNEVGQFTKIISIKNGVYGISGWTTKGNALKATVAHNFVNGYGLKYAGVTLEAAGKGNTAAKAPAVKSNPTAKTPAQKAAATKKANAAKAAKAKKAK